MEGQTELVNKHAECSNSKGKACIVRNEAQRIKAALRQTG